MNLSKSEGVWGNKKSIPYITKCYATPLQQPETQPDNDGDWAKTDHVSEASPSQSPSDRINYLLLFINSMTSYGSGNRIKRFACVIRVLTSVRDPFPLPLSALSTQTSTKIFSRKRPWTNERYT